MDSLLQFAAAVEGQAELERDEKPTEEQKQIAEEINTLQIELHNLRKEFKKPHEHEGSDAWSCFLYELVEEDSDNMTLEALASMVQAEDENNAEMIQISKNFFKYEAALRIQRIYRGHVGRRIFNVSRELWRSKILPSAALMIQKNWRRMKESRTVEVLKLKQNVEFLEAAASQIQRMQRGMIARKQTKAMLDKVHQDSTEFFRTQ
ncbi:hypothetical protein GUITHDRAFT_100806 [Guillardia theta CCMP2712]|uniref:Uncharacterized protein n=1 Tax=Guillardia theta (strain CCMP2712) TaxID=905079 RepID=L1K084_GUITC|nr:hypothetical protein GUITHDRAFT_100806 [Guillardia theta CCMP2712]EKX53840.1 hypothetical protein GUITHDRAFT_100806 [Guillardia theta CCMP2712]|eukprot:XP_005840820.1 hypothetical protein GUITHDRAFT_100806 [Guillardia theta CCMP2712]